MIYLVEIDGDNNITRYAECKLYYDESTRNMLSLYGCAYLYKCVILVDDEILVDGDERRGYWSKSSLASRFLTILSRDMKIRLLL